MPLRRLLIVLLALLGACTTVPVDPATRWLVPGEVVHLRIAAQLLEGHDMTEPAYDAADGYKPIPSHDGELLLTEFRLLFLARGSDGEPSMLSLPYPDISRARPSKTPLLHYIVVWDAKNQPDSFLVGQRDVQELHRQFAVAWAKGRQQQAGKRD